MPSAEKTVSWILKGGLLLTPFLVFVVTRSLYFPFITGKNFAFRILIELLAVVWVYAIVRFPRLRPNFSPLIAAATAFVAVMGLAAMFALSPYRSFWSNFERMEGYIAILHLFVYFLMLAGAFQTERDWKIFFGTSIASSVLVGLYGVFQLARVFDIHQGGTRVDATFGNATYLAAYLLFHVFFIGWFAAKTKNIYVRVVLALALLLELFILYHTATRGAMLGLLGGAMLFLALAAIFPRRSGDGAKVSFWRTPRAWAGASLLVLLFVPVLFYSVRNNPAVLKNPVLSRFATISPSEITTQSRFTIWKMAFEGWRERPLLGWGQDAFLFVFSKYYEPSLWPQEPWFDRAHNVFLDWLVAGGILGLLSYLSMYAAALWMLIRAWRRGRIDGAAVAFFSALLAAHFFQNLFVFDNLTSYLLFFAVLAAIHAISTEPAAQRQRRPRTVPHSAAAAFGAATLVIVAVLLYVANVKPILAASSILDALQMQGIAPAGRVDGMLAAFQRGVSLNTFGTTELREQMAQTGAVIARDPAIAPQDQAKFFSYAISELEMQRKVFPSDIRAKAFLATLYTQTNQPAKAIEVLDEALKISDQRPQFYFVAAEAYFNAGDTERAIAALKRAYDLAPDYPEAQANLAVVYILTGREAEAEALIQKSNGTPFIGDPRFADAYARVGHFQKAARVLELAVGGSPKDAKSHATLGVIYARLKRPADAIREIRRAMELEPGFVPQGESLISQIQAGKTP